MQSVYQNNKSSWICFIETPYYTQPGFRFVAKIVYDRATPSARCLGFSCGEFYRAGVSYPAGLPGFGGLVDQVYEHLNEAKSTLEQAECCKGLHDRTLALLENRMPRALFARRPSKNFSFRKIESAYASLVAATFEDAGGNSTPCHYKFRLRRFHDERRSRRTGIAWMPRSGKRRELIAWPEKLGARIVSRSG